MVLGADCRARAPGRQSVAKIGPDAGGRPFVALRRATAACNFASATRAARGLRLAAGPQLAAPRPRQPRPGAVTRPAPPAAGRGRARLWRAAGEPRRDVTPGRRAPANLAEPPASPGAARAPARSAGPREAPGSAGQGTPSGTRSPAPGRALPAAEIWSLESG